MDERGSAYSRLAFFGSAAMWNVCQSAFQVLLPLYALSLGLSMLKIASVVAIPSVVQFVVRLAGGVLSDRFGEHRILQGCYFIMVMAALSLAAAEGTAGLFLAQTVSHFSRATFWGTAQSLASQLPGSHSGKKLGRLSACANTGSLLGYLVGGVLPAYFGYRSSFFMLVALTLLGFASGFLMPRTRPKPSDRSLWEISTGIVRFLRQRPAWLAISASYSSALPASLAQTIYPVYLTALSFGTGWVGLAVSLRALGVVAAALTIARLITPAREKLIYGVALAVIGLALIGSGLSKELFFLSACIAVLGTAGGAMDIFYQVQATHMSKEADRAVAFAAVGIGWTLSHLFSPLVAGALVEAYGFPFAFAALGAFMLLAAAGTKLWYRLLMTKATALKAA